MGWLAASILIGPATVAAAFLGLPPDTTSMVLLPIRGIVMTVVTSGLAWTVLRRPGRTGVGSAPSVAARPA